MLVCFRAGTKWRQMTGSGETTDGYSWPFPSHNCRHSKNMLHFLQKIFSRFFLFFLFPFDLFNHNCIHLYLSVCFNEFHDDYLIFFVLWNQYHLIYAEPTQQTLFRHTHAYRYLRVYFCVIRDVCLSVCPNMRAGISDAL